MNSESVMQQLEVLGKERTKKIYISNGAREPVFGVATGAMKPLAKLIKINQPLADQLYTTGNYDAMYFAGIIADPHQMTHDDFNRWIDLAYFYMLSDYVVAVTLAESPIAQDIADEWIASDDELKMSAGWSCYCWLLGSRKDEEFSAPKLLDMVQLVKNTIHEAPDRAKVSMNNFLTTVGVSFKPLHEQALEIAQIVGPIEIKRDNKKPSILHAYENIIKEAERNRIGFKRKHVRC
ncbi:DNA alkylation repair protein [Peribacillus sp. FSL H8-0477]|uniref:DNA alkylation repair protein n=1 Tax=Peribacillus sp. FSL H8-0477 TaxID=2921388 RepID=UPI0030FA3403